MRVPGPIVVGVWLTLCGRALAAAPETIIVTGVPLPEPLATVPDSTAVLDTPTIDRINAEHPSEDLNRLPGVLINRGNGMEHLTAIRSPVLTGGAGAGSFLFLEDGIPLRSAGFANVNELFDAHTELAKSIEVVRGPGGALYGSNAEHGLIDVISRGPGDPSFAQLSAGSFGRGSLRAFLASGDASNGNSFALTLNHENGFRANSGLDQQKLTERGIWSSGDVTQSVTFEILNLNQETAGYVVGHLAYKSTALDRGNMNPEAFRDAHETRASYRFERALANGGADTLVVYARGTDMEFLQHFNPDKALEKDWDWSTGWQARRTLKIADNNEVAFGIDGEFADGATQEVQTLPTFGSNPKGVHYDYVVLAEVLAPYLHTEWQLSPRTRLTAGARYEVMRYVYDTHAAPGIVGQFQRPADRTDTFRAFTPNLALAYDLSNDFFLYGRLARGARAPQTSDVYRLQSLQTVGAAKTETLDSAEIGTRGHLLGVSFDLATYYMLKRHYYFRDADGFNVTDGRTRHRGVELSFTDPITPALSLTGSFSYALHTYAFNRPVTSSATEVIKSGNVVDTAPRVLADASLLWTPAPTFETEFAWTHVGKYFTDAANEHSYSGHHVFDLRFGYHMLPHAEVRLAVRNLFNTDYAERADYAFGQERYFPGETRGFEFIVRADL